MNIKAQKKTVAEFVGCERGAHEDDLRGPSPLTTVEILERSEISIEINTAEEAAQIADCCDYGTFPDFCPNAADRIRFEALKFLGAPEVLRRWQSDQMDALRQLVSESRARDAISAAR